MTISWGLTSPTLFCSFLPPIFLSLLRENGICEKSITFPVAIPLELNGIPADETINHPVHCPERRKILQFSKYRSKPKC